MCLLPVFERESGYQVKTIAIGSGEAIEVGARGEADVPVRIPAERHSLLRQGRGAW